MNGDRLDIADRDHFVISSRSTTKRYSVRPFFIRTPSFRVAPEPFLFSGQFQPGNVLTNVPKFQ